MTKREMSKNMQLSLQQHFPEYYFDQHAMYKPFADNYFIKGYLFFSNYDNEAGLKVTCFIMPLFVPTDVLAFSYAQELYYTVKKGLFKKERCYRWDSRKEALPHSFDHIKEVIQKEFDLF